MKSYKILLLVLFISCCFTSTLTSADIIFCNFSELDSVSLHPVPPPAHTHTHTHTHIHTPCDLTAKSASMTKVFSRCSLNKYSAATLLTITNANMVSYKYKLFKIYMVLCMLVKRLASI